MPRLNAKALRTTEPTQDQLKKIKRQPIYIICDNVLDTYNVGAIFRLADAVAAEKVYLCGQTETPPNHKIKKASVSTWKWIKWQQLPSANEAIAKLKARNPKLKTYVIEQHARSQRFDQVKYELPLALVVGNETYGVSPEVLEMCDTLVELPMFGINKSLNVMVSLGIVLYKVVEKCLP